MRLCPLSINQMDSLRERACPCICNIIHKNQNKFDFKTYDYKCDAICVCVFQQIYSRTRRLRDRHFFFKLNRRTSAHDEAWPILNSIIVFDWCVCAGRAHQFCE